MSFILNALKKSEQDRQISQDQSVVNKTPERQDYKLKKISSWLFFLVIVNVFFLSYIIWIFTKDSNTGESIKNIALENSDKTDKVKTDNLQNPNINLAKVSPDQTITKQIKKQKKIDEVLSKKRPETVIALNETDVVTEIVKNKSVAPKNPQSYSANANKAKVLQTRQSDIKINQPINEAQSKTKPEAITALNETDVVTEFAKNNSVVSENPKKYPTNANKAKVLQSRQSTTQINQPINEAPSNTKPDAIIVLNETDVVTADEKNKSAELKNPQSDSAKANKPKVLKTIKSEKQTSQPINPIPFKIKPDAITALNEIDAVNKIDKNNSVVSKNSQLNSTNILKEQQPYTENVEKPQTQGKDFVDEPIPESSIQIQNSLPVSENKNTESEIQQQIEATNNLPIIKSTAKENRILPPFLSDLEYEFRRTVPDVKINVYVYSKNKNKRFIMINMRKFVPGQEIIDGMILNEILMNSIIVDYGNRIFQINRK